MPCFFKINLVLKAEDVETDAKLKVGSQVASSGDVSFHQIKTSLIVH